MYGHRYLAIAALLIVGQTLSACSTAQTVPEQDVRQHAVNRWTHCVERYSDRYRGSIERAGKRANNYCEGHRRDVLALYPNHLKNQIESLLSQRADTITTTRVVRADYGEYLDAVKGSPIDTLKNRLREARQSDL